MQTETKVTHVVLPQEVADTFLSLWAAGYCEIYIRPKFTREGHYNIEATKRLAPNESK